MRKFNKANFIIGIGVLLITILFPVLALHAQDLAIVKEMGGAFLPIFPENQRVIAKDIFVDSKDTGSTQVEWEVEVKKFTVSYTWSLYAVEGDSRVDPVGCYLGKGRTTIELWNVGELGGEEYAYASVIEWSLPLTEGDDVPEYGRTENCPDYIVNYYFEQKDFLPSLRFSGGPNGVVYSGDFIYLEFINGNKIVSWECEREATVCDEIVFDQSVFSNWADPPGAVEEEVPETEVEISHEYIYTTYGIDVWDSFGLDGYDRAVWSDQELTWLNDVLKELPPALIDRMAVNRIVRNTIYIDEDGNRKPSTFGVYEPCDISFDPHCDGSSATIRIFDHARSPFDFLNDPDGEKQFKATILHEMVHGMQEYKDRHSIYGNVYSPLVENWIDATRQITDIEDPGFNGWNGWNWDGQRYRYTNDSGNQPPTNYGLTDPSEDMAESVMMYVYDPERLKNSSYERYYFIRDEMFGGVEYEDGVQKKP